MLTEFCLVCYFQKKRGRKVNKPNSQSGQVTGEKSNVDDLAHKVVSVSISLELSCYFLFPPVLT